MLLIYKHLLLLLLPLLFLLLFIIIIIIIIITTTIIVVVVNFMFNMFYMQFNVHINFKPTCSFLLKRFEVGQIVESHSLILL